MLTDVSSEMVNSIVPLFLTFQLGFSRFQFGLFNGVYQVLAAATALIGGAIADRHRRYKEVAGIGYGISAATRVGLVVAQNAWIPGDRHAVRRPGGEGIANRPTRRPDLPVSAARPPRRGLRGSPGDGHSWGRSSGPSSLSYCCQPSRAATESYSGPASGSHSAALPCWCCSFATARRQPALHGPSRRAPSRSVEPSDSFAFPEYRRLVCAGSALSMVTIADALVYATFQQRSSMTTRFFPLLYVGTALAYLFLALPMGRLADRIGPTRVFVGGQALLLVVDAMLLLSSPGPLSLIFMLGALGTYYAATDGILAVVATSILPDQQRASGLALLGAAMALAAFAASTVFGALWEWKGPTFAVAVFLVGLVVSLVTALGLLGPQLRRERSGVVANSFGWRAWP